GVAARQRSVRASPRAPGDAASTRAVVGWSVTAGLWLYYLTPVLVRLPEIPWSLVALVAGSGAVGVVAVVLHRRRPLVAVVVAGVTLDRKSTRLNSSHVKISYAVFCLKKK